MEKIRNDEENVLCRFAKSNKGKLAGLLLLAFSTVETTRTAANIINEDYKDAKISSSLGVAELSIGAAIFVTRRSGASKEKT